MPVWERKGWDQCWVSEKALTSCVRRYLLHKPLLGINLLICEAELQIHSLKYQAHCTMLSRFLGAALCVHLPSLSPPSPGTMKAKHQEHSHHTTNTALWPPSPPCPSSWHSPQCLGSRSLGKDGLQHLAIVRGTTLRQVGRGCQERELSLSQRASHWQLFSAVPALAFLNDGSASVNWKKVFFSRWFLVRVF